MHGPALGVIVQSVLDGMPLLPGEYTPEPKLLPTPTTAIAKAGADPTRRDRPSSGGDDLRTTIQESFSGRSGYLPTPTTQDATNAGGPAQGDRRSPGLNWLGPALTAERDDLDPPGEQIALDLDDDPDARMDPEPGAVDWGPFSGGIALWALVLDRPAPHPVEPGPNGDRLSPAFVEWLMGFSPGWITDVPGLTYRQQLGALGNAVVPKQAAYALEHLGLTWPRPEGLNR